MIYDLYSEQEICTELLRHKVVVLLINYEQNKYYKKDREEQAYKIQQEAAYLSRHYSGMAFFCQYNTKKYDDGAFDTAAKYEYYPRIYLFDKNQIIITAKNIEQCWQLESILRANCKRTLLRQYRKMYDLEPTKRKIINLLKDQKGQLQ